MANVPMDKTTLDKDRILTDINKRPTPDKVVSGKVSTEKSNLVAEIFRPILSKALTDSVITVMSTISDIVIGAVDMKVYGERRHHSGRRGGVFDYSSISRSGTTTSLSQIYRERTSGGGYNYSAGYNVKEVRFANAGEAELVLDSLYEYLDTYGIVTVGDFYSLCNCPTASIDFKYGWTDLSKAERRPTRDGYIINFPRPRPID